jgi:small-conductance mechanosensitive channel
LYMTRRLTLADVLLAIALFVVFWVLARPVE